MLISIDALTKSYGSVPALDNARLTIEPGQIVSVLGPNGAGKTSLLLCLAGIVGPNSGRILYDGERFQRGRMDLRRRFCFLPDFPFLFPDMTVVRHIGMMLRLYRAEGDGVEDRVIEILRNLDMLPLTDTKFGALSRGQIYKAALAGLLAVSPEVWLLDEPFASGMDPAGIIFFRKQAREAAARGGTVVYSTQILEVAEKFSDRVCLLQRGRCAFTRPSRSFAAAGAAKVACWNSFSHNYARNVSEAGLTGFGKDSPPSRSAGTSHLARIVERVQTDA